MRSDEEIVDAVRRGDQDRAFAELHGRYADHLRAYCSRVLGSPDDAEDAVQQTFLKAHLGIQRDEREIELRPWLFSIAHNESVTLLRKRRPAVSLTAEDLVAHDHHPAKLYETREELRETMRDLARLPSEQREALVLTGLYDVPAEEVAEIIGCDRAKVKSLVFRARARLSEFREARQIDCAEVRELICDSSGAGLRKRLVKEHLRDCGECRDLAERPAHRRRLVAHGLLWPIVALKSAGLTFSGTAAAAIAAGAIAGGVVTHRDAPPPPDPAPQADAAAKRAAQPPPPTLALLSTPDLRPGIARVRPPASDRGRHSAPAWGRGNTGRDGRGPASTGPGGSGSPAGGGPAGSATGVAVPSPTGGSRNPAGRDLPEQALENGAGQGARSIAPGLSKKPDVEPPGLAKQDPAPAAPASDSGDTPPGLAKKAEGASTPKAKAATVTETPETSESEGTSPGQANRDPAKDVPPGQDKKSP